MKISSFVFSLFIIALVPFTASAQAREEARILTATQVLEELKTMRDQNVPDWLLARAYGVAVIPDVVKVGLIAGARRGKGVLVVRNASGQWSNPVFITLTGGSIGWQAGVQSTDVVLVFTTKDSVEGITDGKLTLGADASVAAGPVGRQTSAATDPNLNAEVYSYSRARGLFAGIALDGSAITIDRKGNASFYQRAGVTAGDILSASAPQPPAAARRFVSALGQTAPAYAAGKQTSEPAANAPAQAPAARPQASELKTYPMEDPAPGEEPKTE